MEKNIENAALTFIDTHENEMIDLWRDIVKIESPSYLKTGVDAVGTKIEAFCREKLGYYTRFQFDEIYGNCLCACSCPFEEYSEGIVLSAHMDTVFKPGFFDPVIEEDDEYIYGPGAGDCKGGLIMSLLTAWALKESGYTARPIKLVFAADEESGGPTGWAFYPRELKNTAYMFNAESGKRNEIVTGRKSSIIAVFHIKGEASHVGYLNGKPKSAVREAACKLLALEDSSDYKMLTFVGGVIDGGTVATSVPNECTLQVNVRISDSSVIDKAIGILNEICEKTFTEGTSCTMEIRGRRIPMSENSTNIELCKRFSDASVSLGFGEFKHIFVGGASDASYASEMGIPVICATGPVVDYQHTRNERVIRSSMAQRAKIHVKTILSL